MQLHHFMGLACLVAVLQHSAAQMDWPAMSSTTTLQKGDGTYYGLNQDLENACSYGTNFADTTGLPWSKGLYTTIAMNDAQFDESAACGTCIMYRGAGGDKPYVSGTQPVPQTWQKALVNNRCPECHPGDIDQGMEGNGRWKVEWFAVPCETHGTNVHYSVVKETQYWTSFVISNFVVPIKAVQIKFDGIAGGEWFELTRQTNNQWPYYNSAGRLTYPLRVQVHAITGQVIEDVLADNKPRFGAVQFDTPPMAAMPTQTVGPAPLLPNGDTAPSIPAYKSSSTGNSSASASTTAASSAPTSTTTATATPAASASGPAGTTTATSSSGSTPTPAPAASSASTPAPTATPAAAASSSTSAAGGTAEKNSASIATNPNSSSATASAAQPSSAAASSLQNIPLWGQCGGTGVGCKGDQCRDAVWNGATCAAPYNCYKFDATWWQCRKNDNFADNSARRRGRKLLSSDEQ